MSAAESVAKAMHDAEFLVNDLQNLHKSICRDNPTLESKLAEAHVLAMLAEAVGIAQSLKGVA